MSLTLFNWQQEHAKAMLRGVTDRGFFLDTSETGTGKTYVAAWIAEQLRIPVIVIAPKSVCTAWRRVLATLPSVVPPTVTNVEQVKRGNTPFVTATKDAREKWAFRWNLPDQVLVVFDECQGYGGIKSDNAILFASLGLQRKTQPGWKVLALSATPFDSPLKCRALGFVLGWHNWTESTFYNWALRHGCYRSPWHNALEFGKGPKAQEALQRLRDDLKPWTSRLRVSDIPEFKDGVVEPVLIDLSARELTEINEMYEGLSDVLTHESKTDNALTIGLRARQKSEWFKAPWLFEASVRSLEEGRSVVIFCSFNDTLDWLTEKFLAEGIPTASIRGGQSEAERQGEIDRFQCDQATVCLCNLASGGVGVSLHHTAASKRPRYTLITPSFKAEHLVQALGRTPRAGSLSSPLQRIVLAAGSIEETVFDTIVRKLGNFDTLLDSDLLGTVQAGTWKQRNKKE